MTKSTLIAAFAAALIPLGASAQRVLTIDECRDMAVEKSRNLTQARTQVDMAGYDRKIALANYFPKISATGVYMYNSADVALISDEGSERLRNAGTDMQAQMKADAKQAIANSDLHYPGLANDLVDAIDALPETAMMAERVNAIGREIDDALHPDLHNLYLGAVTVEQPLFVGGKIIYSNKMAALAEQLASARYDSSYAEVILDVDQAYWQIVSIAGKKRLAESYADLLHKMEKDVDLSIKAGVMTESDALQIKVKANEADMLLTKAGNGLDLAKMLLCKRIGLPLDSMIMLADEDQDRMPVPVRPYYKSMDDILADRPEIRSLELASGIYDYKAKIVRADYLPKVALTANYLISNPNADNGIRNEWGHGAFVGGVMVSVPICHGLEGAAKYRKAKAEASLYRSRCEDAKEMINLQVTQQRKLIDEATEKLMMAESNLKSAEENLRTAMVGFEAGVVETNTVLGAQTAWLSAHSEYIDAGTELQMACASLRKAEGEIKSR